MSIEICILDIKMNTISDTTNIIIKSLTNKEIVRLILSNKEQIQAIDFVTLFKDRFGKFKQELNLSNLPLIIANNITDEEQKIAANKFIHFTRGFRIRHLFFDKSLQHYGNKEFAININEERDYPRDLGYIKLCANEHGSHVVALKNDGSVFTIRSKTLEYLEEKFCEDPTDKDFVDVACGNSQSIGLKENGSIVTWSNYKNDLVNSPNDTGYTAIACGKYHSIALKNDGKIVMWGMDNINNTKYNFPDDKEYIEIDSGDYHGAALKNDGSISIWGGKKQKRGNPVITSWTRESRFCPEGNDYIHIACKKDNTIALKNDKSFIIFNSNDIVYQGIYTLEFSTKEDLKKLLHFYENNSMDLYQNLSKDYVATSYNSNKCYVNLKKDGGIQLQIKHNFLKRIYGDNYEDEDVDVNKQFSFLEKCKFVQISSTIWRTLGLQYINGEDEEEEDEEDENNDEEEIPSNYLDFDSLDDY